MTVFKKITCKYDELHTHLGFDEPLRSAIKNEQEYQSFLDIDLPRTPFVSFTNTAEYVKSKLREYHNASISQGDIDACAYLEDSLTLSPAWQRAMQIRSNNNIAEACKEETIRFAYIDDEGKNCGLSIAVLRKDPDVSSGEENCLIENRPRYFSIGFIRNTTSALNEREVTYFMHPDFLLDGVAEKNNEHIGNVEANDIPGQLRTVLNSDKIYQLIHGLFRGEQIDLNYHSQLDKRLSSNKNIDNRDLKLKQIERFIAITRQPPLNTNRELQQYINSLNDDLANNSNLLIDENYPQLIQQIKERINRAITTENADEIQTDDDANIEENLKTKLAVTYLAVLLEHHAETLKTDNTNEERKQQAMLWQAKKLYIQLDSNNFNYLDSFKNESLDSLCDASYAEIIELQKFIQTIRYRNQNNQGIEQLLSTIEERTLSEIDFFDPELNNIGNFQEQLNVLLPQSNEAPVQIPKSNAIAAATYEPESINATEKNFLQRNAKDLGLMSTSVSVLIPAVVFLGLFLGGVFSPFGIVILGATATTLGITLTTVATIFTALSLFSMLLTTIDIISTETNHRNKNKTPEVIKSLAGEYKYIQIPSQDQLLETDSPGVTKESTHETTDIAKVLAQGERAVTKGLNIEVTNPDQDQDQDQDIQPNQFLTNEEEQMHIIQVN